MKKLAFVETNNTNETNNETAQKIKLVKEITRHIFEDDDAYEKYAKFAEKVENALAKEREENTPKSEVDAAKEAVKVAKAKAKKEREVEKLQTKADKFQLKADHYYDLATEPEVKPEDVEEA